MADLLSDSGRSSRRLFVLTFCEGHPGPRIRSSMWGRSLLLKIISLYPGVVSNMNRGLEVEGGFPPCLERVEGGE